MLLFSMDMGQSNRLTHQRTIYCRYLFRRIWLPHFGQWSHLTRRSFLCTVLVLTSYTVDFLKYLREVVVKGGRKDIAVIPVIPDSPFADTHHCSTYRQLTLQVNRLKSTINPLNITWGKLLTTTPHPTLHRTCSHDFKVRKLNGIHNDHCHKSKYIAIRHQLSGTESIISSWQWTN